MKKVIIISGGSDGVGKEVAKKLSADFTIVILGRNAEKTRGVAKELGVDFEVCDVSDKEQVKAAVKSIVEKHQRIDGLINNAGVWIEGYLEDNDFDAIEEVIDVNYKGTVLLTRAVVPHMIAQKSGNIFNVVSMAGLMGKAERSIYNSSKFAVTGFTKSLQFDLAQHGIKVTGLYPAMIKTNLFEKAGYPRDLDRGMPASEIAELIEFLLKRPDYMVYQDVVFKHINN